MKRIILTTFSFLIAWVSFAQVQRDLKHNKDTNLIEVVYYHDNGAVSQKGTYTTGGKLQGEWLSYNSEGEKQISANYNNGEKVGKWFFWSQGTLKEVDYRSNIIVNVIVRRDYMSILQSN